MHYLTHGNINLLHKRSFTFIKDIGVNTFLGEIAFFSDGVRSASAISKNFTEMLTIERNGKFRI